MLIEMLIAMSCASGQYNEACKKAMEAGTKQYGIYQNFEKAEEMGKTAANKEIASTVGAGPAAVVGTAAKVVHDKAITYSVKPGDVLSIDRITTKIGQQGNGRGGSLNLEWRF